MLLKYLCLLVTLLLMLSCKNENEDIVQPKNESPVEQIEGWTEKASMPTPRIAIGICEYQNKIYTFGGFDGESAANSFEVYDISSNVWEILDSIPTRRGFTASCLVNNKIYIIGGTDDKYFNKTLKTNEEYDPLTASWNLKEDMPTSRAGTISFAFDNKIFIVSGRTAYLDENHEFPKTDVVEMYDPVTDAWEAKTNIPTSRAHINATVLNDNVFVIGGELYKIGRVVEIYDPNLDSWSRKNDLPYYGYHNSITVSLNGKIYIFGGSQDIEKLIGTSTLYEYDPDTEECRQLPDLPIHITLGSAIAVGDKIYIMGTATGPWPLKPLANVYEFDPVLFSNQ